MTKVLYLFLLLTLAACTMPAAQPFAALSNMPEKNAPGTPTTNAAQLVGILPTPPPHNPTQRACIVTAAAWLNLRSDAGTFAPVDVVLSHGAQLEVNDQRGAWLAVTTADGRRGWVNSAYCK